ncbi:MAG: hypothetical protein ACRETA_04490 [Gammaproteobacteria bacterium]
METEPNKQKGSVSKGLGDFFGGIMAHKGMLLGIGGAIVVIVIVYYVINNQNSSNNTANSAPDLSSGGYLPSDISAQLASINNQLSSLGQGTGGTTSGTGGTTAGGGGTTTGGAAANEGPWLPLSYSGTSPLPPATGSQGSQSPLYGAGYWVTGGRNTGQYMIYNNKGQSFSLNNLFPFQGATFVPGGGGRLWYSMPGQASLQLLTNGGYLGENPSGVGNNWPGMSRAEQWYSG